LCFAIGTLYYGLRKDARVARNEEGEFELILGNRQLLSVFFLVVLLLGLCFVGGYVLGRSAAPVLTATAVPPQQEPAKTVAVSAPQPAPAVQEEAPAPVPVQTAPQAPPEPEQVAPKAEPVKPKAEPVKPKAEPVKAKAEAPKPEPPKAEAPKPQPAKPAAAKLVPPTGGPIPGRIYLQLSATDKDKADTMVDLLRSRSLPGMAAPIPDKPGLFRVLVGPMAESGVQDMRTKLKSAGFPADQAIKRTF
jgi:hypothetical protein